MSRRAAKVAKAMQIRVAVAVEVLEVTKVEAEEEAAAAALVEKKVCYSFGKPKTSTFLMPNLLNFQIKLV